MRRTYIGQRCHFPELSLPLATAYTLVYHKAIDNGHDAQRKENAGDGPSQPATIEHYRHAHEEHRRQHVHESVHVLHVW